MEFLVTVTPYMLSLPARHHAQHAAADCTGNGTSQSLDLISCLMSSMEVSKLFKLSLCSELKLHRQQQAGNTVPAFAKVCR